MIFALNKPSSLALVSIAALLAPLGAQAGDIYNGPVQSGESIPVNVDREITYRALTVAIDKCTSDAAIEVARQIFPERDPNAFRGGSIVATFAQAQFSFRDRDGLKLPVMDGTVQVEPNQGVLAVYQNVQDLSLKSDAAVEGYLVVTPDGFFTSPSKRSVRAPWPQFAFTEVTRSKGFDVFGSPIDPYLVAQDLRIVKPMVSSTAVPFENIATGKKVEFTANSERYVNCLLTEIAR